MSASPNLQIPPWSSETQLPPSEPQHTEDMHRYFLPLPRKPTTTPAWNGRFVVRSVLCNDAILPGK